MNEKILVIEDGQAMREFLKVYLEEEGYQVDLAQDGLVGMEKFQNKTYDLILLDVMMPKIDGYLVLEMIRQISKIPVMMLTAMEKEQDQIKAFDLLTDDYITKPFSIELLLRRIKALLRRGDLFKKELLVQEKDVLRHETLSLNLKTLEVFNDGKLIKLTKKELELIKLLIQNPKQVFTREILLEQLWGYDFYGNPKIVNIHMQNLRNKLGGCYIETVRGMGYRLGEKEKK